MPSALGGQAAISFLPAGAMVDFAGTTAPSGWLMCDGAAVSRTVYASLFSSLGTAYGVGDGSTTFNLPDYRGRFARYMDNMGTSAGAASRDTGRARGSPQTDAMQNATGTFKIGGKPNYSYELPNGLADGVFAVGGGPYSDYTIFGATQAGTTGGSTIFDLSRVARTAAETRPINLSCNRIIKY